MGHNRKEEINRICRASIIDAAEKLLIDKKFTDITIEEIATASKYSKRTLYSYIKSKDEIYAELTSRWCQKLFEYFNENLNGRNPKKGIKSLFEYIITMPDHDKIYFSLLTIVEPQLQPCLTLLTNSILTGIVDKDFDLETDAGFSAELILALFLGAVFYDADKIKKTSDFILRALKRNR